MDKIILSQCCHKGLLCLSLLLVGCTRDLVELSCTTADWQALGFKHGQAGQPLILPEEEFARCRQIGVYVAPNCYIRGWRLGNQRYCQPRIGYTLGVRGQEYPRFCPQRTLPNIIANWKRGAREYCRPNTGFLEGKAGNPLSQICPVDLKERFVASYQRGFAQYQALQKVKKQYQQVTRLIEHTAKQKLDVMAQDNYEEDDPILQQKLKRVSEKLRVYEQEQEQLLVQIDRLQQ